jgi:cell division protein FtsL
MTALQTARAERVPRRAPATTRPVAGRPETRRLRAVPTPVPRPRPAVRWAYSLLAGVILTVGVIGIVALNAMAAEASFQARALESDISDLTLRHDDLVAEVATLAAPSRVRDVARTQLGLVEAEQPGFLTLDPSHLDPAQPKGALQLGDPDSLLSAQG